MATSAETPTDLESQLLALERRYWQALKDRDVATVVALTDDPCIVTGPQGVGLIDRQSMAKMMKDAPYTLDDFHLSDDAQVRMLGDDVAIIAYKAQEDFTVEGQSVSLEAAESSTWVRRDEGWVCALHTEALSGDPFGRDRRTR
jgi:hypothetical protein